MSAAPHRVHIGTDVQLSEAASLFDSQSLGEALLTKSVGDLKAVMPLKHLNPAWITTSP